VTASRHITTSFMPLPQLVECQWRGRRRLVPGERFRDARRARDRRSPLSCVDSWRGAAESREEARATARRLNEHSAELVRDHPGRRILRFAELPDVDGALEELAFTNWAPTASCSTATARASTWASRRSMRCRRTRPPRCGRLRHPSTQPGSARPGVPGVRRGLPPRHRPHRAVARAWWHTPALPGMKVIPVAQRRLPAFAAVRLAGMATVEGALCAGELSCCSGSTLDPALAGSGFALPSIVTWAQADHITFGTDCPTRRCRHHRFHTDGR
jgi:6-methylsalicylate decarboxylase